MAGMERCCRLETYRYTLYTKFQEPKLFRLAAKGDWDMIPERARTHPKEAAFVHRYAPMDTALHRVLRPTTTNSSCAVHMDEETQQEMNVMKLKAVAALLEAHRQALLIQDSFGRTPLHLACMDIRNGGAEAAMMIMDSVHDGAAACVPDTEGRTPLHYLVARNDIVLQDNNSDDGAMEIVNNNNIHLELISKLVAFWPEALSRKDIVGETPLDVVTARRGEWSRADELLTLLLDLQQQHHQHQEQEQPRAGK